MGHFVGLFGIIVLLCSMIRHFQYTVADLIPYIDWVYFHHAWQVSPRSAQGEELKAEALQRLEGLGEAVGAEALYLWAKAHSEDDNLILEAMNGDSPTEETSSLRLPLLRQQRLGKDGLTHCLADFIAPAGGAVGLFATTSHLSAPTTADPYEDLMVQTLATRLAEAAAEKLDDEMLKEMEDGRYASKGIRPAIGYPSLPDLSLIFLLNERLHMDNIGITLTENGAMTPPSSVCGLIIRHPAASYFAVGTISNEQFDDYTRRRELPPERMRQFLRASINE